MFCVVRFTTGLIISISVLFKLNSLNPQYGLFTEMKNIVRTRHDSEVQGGGCEQHGPPSRGASCSSNGPSHGVMGGWRDNNQEMEDFEMEMD